MRYETRSVNESPWSWSKLASVHWNPIRPILATCGRLVCFSDAWCDYRWRRWSTCATGSDLFWQRSLIRTKHTLRLCNGSLIYVEGDSKSGLDLSHFLKVALKTYNLAIFASSGTSVAVQIGTTNGGGLDDYLYQRWSIKFRVDKAVSIFHSSTRVDPRMHHPSLYSFLWTLKSHTTPTIHRKNIILGSD